MGLYKLTKDTAFIGCPNGHSFSVAIDDCVMFGGSISLPACSECGKIISLFCAAADKNDGNYKKHRLNHTLGKRLLALEKNIIEGRVMDVPDENIALAIKWSDDIDESVPSKYLEE